MKKGLDLRLTKTHPSDMSETGVGVLGRILHYVCAIDMAFVHALFTTALEQDHPTEHIYVLERTYQLLHAYV